MKQIIKNKYLKGFKFSFSEEASTFFNSQNTLRRLLIEESFGENYYCYICYHSLTKEKQFVLFFSSDETEENLNIMFWDDLLILDTGKKIYLIDETLKILASFEITSPLVGLYLTNSRRLLLLEETYLRLVDYKGQILKEELYDLMEDFNIKDNLLSLQTGEGNKVIRLD